MAQLIENYMEDPTFKKIMESGIFEYASRGGLTKRSYISAMNILCCL